MSDQNSNTTGQPSDEKIDDLEPRAIDAADASTVKGGFTPLTAQKITATATPQYDLKAQKEA